MKRRNKILTLSASLLMLVSLASCDPKATPKDNLLIEFSDGSISVQADEVFQKYLKTKDGFESVYAQINNAVARHLAYKDTSVVGESKRNQLISEAKAKVDDIISTAKSNSTNNKTSYDDELDKLLKNNGAEDLKELQVIFENQQFKTYLTDKFYDDFIDNLKMGGKIEVKDAAGASKGQITVDSYLDDVLPYHVKHILVKVSASASNYTTSTITESEAIKLSNTINTLADASSNFGQKALNMSDDTGSAQNYGDLGLMSINTSYVNEFKLGLYAYETLFNTSVDKDSAKLNKFMLTDAEAEEYREYIQAHGLNFIPSGVTNLLANYKDVTRDDKNETVNDGNEAYYPRNIVWNEFLNKHEVSFIEYAEVTLKANEQIVIEDPTQPIENSEVLNVSVYDPDKLSFDDKGFVVGTNYRKVNFRVNDKEETHVVLTDGDRNNPKPLLVTRAGTGAGDSGYQGIHFIAVERSALQETGWDGTTLDQYYSTKLPNVNGEIEGLEGKRVYVNAFKDTQKEYQARVDSLISEIKEADNSIEKKINDYYFKKSGAKILDQNIANTYEKYLDADEITADEEARSQLISQWKDYYNLLQRENDERDSEKLIPLVCAIKFNSASSEEDKALFEVGGICHYVEQKD